MNKEKLSKVICSGNVLQSQDVSAEDKKVVFALMEKYGLPVSTAYRRFFDKGFSQWEIEGISNLKTKFVADHADELKAITYSKDVSVYTEIVDVDGIEPGKFYDQLKVAKLANQFKAYMLEHGMCAVTSYKRFVSDDWQEWEKLGIRKILAPPRL